MRKQFLLWFLSTKLYAWLSLKIIPAIRLSSSYTKSTGRAFYIAQSRLKPGDVLVESDLRKLSAKLIPGDWDHAAFVVNDEYIVEMIPNGIHVTTFFDFCKTSDQFAILRAGWNEEYIDQQINMAKMLVSKKIKYDNEFTLGVEALYCSELIKLLDFKGTLQLNLDDLANLGRPYISPQGLYNSPSFTKIFDSREV